MFKMADGKSGVHEISLLSILMKKIWGNGMIRKMYEHIGKSIKHRASYNCLFTILTNFVILL